MKTGLPADKITCVLTSCGRRDLLSETLDTFLAHHEPGRFILVEDSADRDFAQRIGARYPSLEIVLNTPRLGQLRAIDRAYQMVETPFVFHLEDDWAFSAGADVEDAQHLLGERDEVSAVCFREVKTLKLTHRLRARRLVHGGRQYADLRNGHREWHGYSFNPTLVRHATWREHGPFANFANERALSHTMRQAGLHVVYQLPGACGHIGSGRSVFDPSR